MTSRDESLRALADWCSDRQVHWAAQGGDYAQGRVNAFCEAEYEIRQHLDALLSDRQEVAPVADTTDLYALAQEIRRVDGGNTLGAAALAEALLPFIEFHYGESTGQTSDARDAGQFYAACERAAGELPAGWEIRVCLEYGAGKVELCDPEGNVTYMDVDADDRLTAEVNAAIDAAMEQPR